MSDNEPTSRRRFIAECAALGGVAVGAIWWNRQADTVAPPYPAIVIPAGTHPLLRKRLENLHSRYSAVLTTGGVPAVRARLTNDIRSFAQADDWLTSIIEWINIAGWNDAADLLIDIAEIGDNAVRVTASTYLSAKTTPLVTAAVHGRRVVRLYKSETEPIALESWRDIRTRLGV